MFGHEKNRMVQPRPLPPMPDRIVEDLQSASDDDIAFLILTNDKANSDDLHFPTNANDPANIYKKVKTYLDVNNTLKTLNESLCDCVRLLSDVDRDIMKLAHEIKGHGRAALVE